MSAFIVDRLDIVPATPVGGKARALAELANAGLPVPPWFVVLPEAFDASLTPDVAAALADASDEPALAAAVGRLGMAPEVRAALDAALAAAGATAASRYAVRSSAQDEDGERHSFAGQLESFLDVPAAAVADRVVRVWASGFGARLARYRAEAGLGGRTSVSRGRSSSG